MPISRRRSSRRWTDFSRTSRPDYTVGWPRFRGQSAGPIAAQQQAREAAVSGQVRALRRELPALLAGLGRVPDPRHPKKCRHRLTVLPLYGLLMFVFPFASRRVVNRELTRPQFAANLRLLFPELERLPHAGTEVSVVARHRRGAPRTGAHRLGFHNGLVIPLLSEFLAMRNRPLVWTRRMPRSSIPWASCGSPRATVPAPWNCSAVRTPPGWPIPAWPFTWPRRWRPPGRPLARAGSWSRPSSSPSLRRIRPRRCWVGFPLGRDGERVELLRIGAVEDGDVADAGDERRPGAFDQRRDERVAQFTVPGADLDLQ